MKARDDTKKYPLLFKENINYGYRRNVWGLRSIGIVTSGLCCAAAATGLYMRYRATGNVGEEIAGAFAVAFVFFLLWIFRFSSDWVRIAADAYAARLAESVETMVGNTPAKKK